MALGCALPLMPIQWGTDAPAHFGKNLLCCISALVAKLVVLGHGHSKLYMYGYFTIMLNVYKQVYYVQCTGSCPNLSKHPYYKGY